MSRSRMIAFAASGLLAVSVFAGCKSAAPQEEALPKNKVDALMAADRMQNDGEDLKAQGVKLRNEGKEQEGNALIKQGEEKLVAAQKLREKGMMMKE